jgi:hypothetical protein
MKNLQEYVNKVWEADNIDAKRTILKQMIQASTASRKTKILTTLQVDKASLAKLDSMAINYSLAGEGMKVI